MSSPDDSERTDDGPNSDYAPKWARDTYRQGSPDTAKGGGPPSQRNLTFLRRSLEPETVHFPQRARSLEPETVGLPQPTPRRLGRFAASGGFIIAGALGVVIGLLVAGELPSIFSKAPKSSTKTTEFTSRFDNSKAPEQVSSPPIGLAIGRTAPQATQPSSPTGSLPIAPTIAQSAQEAP